MGIAEFMNTAKGNILVTAIVVLIGAVVSVVSFALLIPLSSVPAASGVTIIFGISYGLAALAWVTVLICFANSPETLNWLNTHLIFLVLLPATIAATAMNVTSIQNTRNLLAGQVAA